MSVLVVLLVVAVIAFTAAIALVWRKLGNVVKGLRALADAEASRGERALVAFGLVLILFGWALPGAVDELVGAVIVVRVAERVAARKAHMRAAIAG